MSSAVSGLFAANSQRKIYGAQSRIATAQAELSRVTGSAQKTKAYADATATEEASKRNNAIAAQQLLQAREKQNEAAGAAETAAASSGFDVGSGSGKNPRAQAVHEFDQMINNMSQSNSISTINAFQRATDLRREGESAVRMAEIEAIGYEGQAAAYKQMERATNRGMVAGAIGSLVGGVAGGVFGGAMGAAAGANMGWNVTATFNPYTAQFTNSQGIGQAASNLMAIFSNRNSDYGWGSYNTGYASGWTPTYNGAMMDPNGYVGRKRY